MTPRLHLLIPGLHPPPKADPLEWSRPPDTPLLHRWLRKEPPAPPLIDPARFAHDHLLPGSQPSAAAAWQAECQHEPTIDQQTANLPPGTTLAHLSPVHLQAGIDTALVFGERFLALTAAEWQTLTVDLRHWLAADDLTLLASQSRRWYLAIPPNSPLGDDELPPLGEALNRSAHGLLDGEHRRGIRRWLTEVQMWLYAHPINAARGQRSLPELNSLWLWGRSSYPADVLIESPDSGHLLTDLPSLAGAWPGSATLIDTLDSDSLHAILNAQQTTRAHLCWTEPAYAALEGDIVGWQQAHNALENLLRNLPPRIRNRCTLDTGAGIHRFPHWQNLWGRLGSK